MSQVSFDTRMVMALATEARRVCEAAERVRLISKAMELRHGVSIAGEPVEQTREADCG